MPARPLPTLRAVLDVVERYRDIALLDLYNIMPEIDDLTLDVPRVGYTRQVPGPTGPEFHVVHRGIPWDHTIHSLRHFRDMADVFDGYAFIDMPYTTQELTLEASYEGGIPPQICDGFTVAIWPVFAVRFKSQKWIRVRRPPATDELRTMAELFAEVYGPGGAA